MTVKSRRQPASSDRRFKHHAVLSDQGTRERWQHSGRMLELTENHGVVAARATEEHIVDILVMRRLLTPLQSEAAFKLKQDYQHAGMEAPVTSRYSPALPRSDHAHREHERNDREEAAYQRWRNAVREMGLGLSNAVLATVCHDCAPSPRDLPALQKGLEKLVDWYRLAQKETTAPKAPPQNSNRPGG